MYLIALANRRVHGTCAITLAQAWLPNPIYECPRYWMYAVGEQGTGLGHSFNRHLSAYSVEKPP
jgi:hypothetical protein